MPADVDTASELPRAKGYRFVRKLGSRAIPTYAAIVESTSRKSDIVAIERFDREVAHVDDVVAFTRGARALVSARPVHVAPLRAVEVDGDGVLLVGDFVDAEPLADLWTLSREAGAPVPVEISLRIALDVLEGLTALHTVVDATGAPMALVHGEVTPANVLVQLDGTAVLRHVCRIKWAALKVRGAPGYLAPELLLREGDIDARGDVYSVGATLFEAISGTKAFPQERVSKVIRTLTTSSVPRAKPPPEAPWAMPIVDIVCRAMSVDRNARFGTPAEMKAAVEGAAAGHIASHADVASWVAHLASDRIAYRRAKILDPSAPAPAPRPQPVVRAPAPAPVPSAGLARLVSGPTPAPAVGPRAAPRVPPPRPPPPVAAPPTPVPIPVFFATQQDRDAPAPVPLPVLEPIIYEAVDAVAPAELPAIGPPPVILGDTPAPGGIEAGEAPAVISVPFNDGEEDLRPRKKRLPLFVALGAGALVAVLALVWVFVPSGRSETSTGASVSGPTAVVEPSVTTPRATGAVDIPAPSATIDVAADAGARDAGAPDAMPDVAKAKPDGVSGSSPKPPSARPRPYKPKVYDPMGI